MSLSMRIVVAFPYTKVCSQRLRERKRRTIRSSRSSLTTLKIRTMPEIRSICSWRVWSPVLLS